MIKDEVRGALPASFRYAAALASAGEFRPYENEGRDGYDTIEWAARQAWSNGSVGTFGLSYPGADRRAGRRVSASRSRCSGASA